MWIGTGCSIDQIHNSTVVKYSIYECYIKSMYINYLY